MAVSYHVRSKSFPTRSHPLIAQADKQLTRLTSSVPRSASSSSSWVCESLNGLQELYSCVGKLLRTSHTKHALSKDHNRKEIEQLLDEYLRLLDACSVTQDGLSQCKENLNDIKSTLRRKRNAEAEVERYISSRKSFKKKIEETAKSLKASDRFNCCCNDEALIMLKSVRVATVSAFDSLFRLICGSEGEPMRCSGWSLVSKFMKLKSVNFQELRYAANEFGQADRWCTLYRRKAEISYEDLERLEDSLHDLEQRLDCLCREMIRIRVSVLHIFDHIA